MQTWYVLITSPVVLIAALVIGSLGEIGKRVVNARRLEAEVVAWRDRPVGYRDSAKPPEPEPYKPDLWKRLYYVTLPAHPILVGMLLGLVPWLPAADELVKPGYEFAAHLATYTFAGILAKIGYDTIISTTKRMLRKKLGDDSRDSTPPDEAT